MKVPPGQAGQKCTCPKCGRQIVAPASDPADAEKRPSFSEREQGQFRETSREKVAETPAAVGEKKKPRADSAPDFTENPSLNSSPPAPLPARPGPGESFERDAAERPAAPSASASAPKRPPRTEYGQLCKLCGSLFYVKPEQIGQETKCPDCHSVNVVKPPREKAKQVVIEDDDDDFRLSDPVERPPMPVELPGVLSTFQDEMRSAASHGSMKAMEQLKPPMKPPSPRPAETKPSGPKPATNATGAIMERALREAEEAEAAMPKLPAKPFSTGLMLFLIEPQAAARGIGLALMMGLIFVVLTWVLAMGSSQGVQQMGSVFLLMPLALLGLVFVFVTAASGIAVLQETSNGRDQIEKWPGWPISDWIGDSFFVINSIFLSFVPGFLVGQVLSCAGVPSWFKLILGTVTLVALLPPMLLSMLEAGSPTAPYSAVIWGSLQKQKKAWKSFYIRAGIVGTLFLVAASLSLSGWMILTAIGCAATVALVLVFFRLLGRLAWVLAEAEEPAESPPQID